MATKSRRKPPADPARPMTDVQRRAAAIRSREANEAAALNLGEPTAEARQHHVYATEKIKDPDSPTPRLVKRNLSRRNLERWHTAGKIDYRQFTAGDRYRTAYERSGFEQRVTSRYEIRVGGSPDYSPAMPGTLGQMDAWKEWRAARDDLGRLAAGFDALAIHDLLVTDIDRSDDPIGIFNRTSVMFAVVICLDRLVDFYRL
jgi:hypothetical protein